jgi:hypothetical protein
VYVTELLVPLRGMEFLIKPGGGGQYQKVAVSRRAGTITKCPFQVLLDGIPMPAAFDLDLLPPPSTLAGIEVYVGAASIPVNLGTSGGRWCGVIAVWTRDGG